MAHLMSPSEVELAKAICEMAGVDWRLVHRVEIIMEIGSATVIRLSVFAQENEAPVEAVETRLHEFKLVPLEA